MKRLLLLSAAALGGCNSAEELSNGSEPTAASQAGVDLALTPLELTAKVSLEKRAKDLKQKKVLEAKVRKAMHSYLIDPFSAKFSGLRLGKAGSVCGAVNAKNRMGAYVGSKQFVLAKDGTTIFVSQFSDGIASELYSSYAIAYLEACATPSEARAHSAATQYNDVGDSYADESAPAEPEVPSNEIKDPFEDI